MSASNNNNQLNIIDELFFSKMKEIIKEDELLPYEHTTALTKDGFMQAARSGKYLITDGLFAHIFNKLGPDTVVKIVKLCQQYNRPKILEEYAVATFNAKGDFRENFIKAVEILDHKTIRKILQETIGKFYESDNVVEDDTKLDYISDEYIIFKQKQNTSINALIDFKNLLTEQELIDLLGERKKFSEFFLNYRQALHAAGGDKSKLDPKWNSNKKKLLIEIVHKFYPKLIDSCKNKDDLKVLDQTLLRFATETYSDNIIKFYIQLNPDHTMPAFKSEVEKKKYAEGLRFNIIKYLLEKGADVNVKDQDRNTHIVFAPVYGNAEIVELLIKKGADINMQGYAGKTALMFAASNIREPGDDNIKIASILVNAGANVNLKDYHDEETALTFAARQKTVEIVKIILLSDNVSLETVSNTIDKNVTSDKEILSLLEAKKKELEAKAVFNNSSISTEKIEHYGDVQLGAKDKGRQG